MSAGEKFKHWNALACSVLLLVLALVTACTQDNSKEKEITAEGQNATDLGWPRVFDHNGQQVIVYQPEVDGWKDYSTLNYRSAVAVITHDGAQPVYGVLEVSAKTRVDQGTRTVYAYEPQRQIRFPHVTPQDEDRLARVVNNAMPIRESLTISLDRVLAYVEDSEPKPRPVQVNLNPPPIFYSDQPAVLVIFVGPPEFQSIPNTALKFAVNTNWDVFLDATTAQYYLLNGKTWLTTSDPVKGTWTQAGRLPLDLYHLPNNANWSDVKDTLLAPISKSVPKVIVSTQPAELLLTDGPVLLDSIPGTNLMYATNTDSTIFFHTLEKNYYYLVAGRWFRSARLTGGWTAATTSLPADFAAIPEDSRVASVLASVPGTQDAADAMLLASIPQYATIDRNVMTVNVSYEGNPKFERIAGTAVQFAINSPNDVFLVDDGLYYCCYQGVWFMAGQPKGHWSVATSVPSAIYTIPPTSPKHNVTYVYVYDATPETVVVGYTSSYTGEYIASGVVMFGAGAVVGAAIANNSDWHYYSYYHYHSNFYSYGCGAVYTKGSYARGGNVYGPYGGAGRGAVYNPSTGSWARGGYIYGPNGSAYARQAYNTQTGVYTARAGGSNVYGSWSRGVVSHGDDWIRGGTANNSHGSAGWVETSGGSGAVGVKNNNGGAVVKTGNGDIYAGKDGNIYRRQDGEWQSNNGSGWTSANSDSKNNGATSAQTSNLNHDAAARNTGNQQASQRSSSPHATTPRAAPAQGGSL